MMLSDVKNDKDAVTYIQHTNHGPIKGMSHYEVLTTLCVCAAKRAAFEESNSSCMITFPPGAENTVRGCFYVIAHLKQEVLARMHGKDKETVQHSENKEPIIVVGYGKNGMGVFTMFGFTCQWADFDAARRHLDTRYLPPGAHKEANISCRYLVNCETGETVDYIHPKDRSDEAATATNDDL